MREFVMYWKRSKTRAAGVLIVLAAVACWGCTAQSREHLYGIAAAGVRAHPDFPDDAVLGTVKDADAFVAKNVACVHIPFRRPGQDQGGVYVVWLKRIAIRWEVDRVGPILPRKVETSEQG